MFDPDLFWRMAQSLLQSENPDECTCRTGAGRAYYAFFLTLRHSLESKHGETFQHSATDHAKVRELLLQRNRDALASALGMLFRLREEADYDLHKTVDYRRVSFAVATVRMQYENARVF